MPNITRAELDALTEKAEQAERQARAQVADAQARSRSWQDTAAVAAEKVKAFDDILDKIDRASHGYAIEEQRHFPGAGYAVAMEREPRMTEEERAQARADAQAERIVELERRLAAVSAIAQFARAHKA